MLTSVREEEFIDSFPHRLTRTNLPGAFALPSIPSKAIRDRAGARELAAMGIPWRRPTSDDPPAYREAWQRALGREWSPDRLIVPEFEPQIGKTHILRNSEPHRSADSGYTGSQWAGGIVNAGSYSGVVGFWNVPHISRPSQPVGAEGCWNVSSWIGIDGFYTTNDVLQAGVDQLLYPNGSTECVAWIEWFTQGDTEPYYVWQTNLTNFPVKPGDQMYCAVNYVNSHTAGSLYLANETTGQHSSVILAPPAGADFSGASAEWIVEAPDGGLPNSSLPKFTPVTFTSAIACGGTVDNPAQGDYSSIVTGDGTQLTSESLADYAVTVSYTG